MTRDKRRRTRDGKKRQECIRKMEKKSFGKEKDPVSFANRGLPQFGKGLSIRPSTHDALQEINVRRL